MRTDIFDQSILGPVTEIPNYRYPFTILVMMRLLTEAHGPGNPELRPVQIRSVQDLVKLKPRQEIQLQDETGVERTYVIDFAAGVVNDQDLLDNTRPDRQVELMKPVECTVPHELGLCDRLNHYIAAGHHLRESLAEGIAFPKDLAGQCDAGESFLVALIDEIQHFTESDEGGTQ